MRQQVLPLAKLYLLWFSSSKTLHTPSSLRIEGATAFGRPINGLIHVIFQ
jgi:hypothetical protein